MVQTGMAAPYGGGVFPPPVNGVAGVVGAASAASEVGKVPQSVPVKEDPVGASQQPPPGGPQVVPPNAASQHPSAPGQPAQPSFSPPSPPNGVVEQQTIVSELLKILYRCQVNYVTLEKRKNFISIFFGFGKN